MLQMLKKYYELKKMLYLCAYLRVGRQQADSVQTRVKE